MTDKKDDQKDSLTSAVNKWIEQKKHCDELRKDAPNASFKNLFKLLNHTISLVTSKRKLRWASRNIYRVLGKRTKDFNKLEGASKDIESKSNSEKRKSDIDELEEGVHYWNQPIKHISLIAIDLDLQSKYVEELNDILNLMLDINNALKVLSDADDDHKAIIIEIREIYSRSCEIAKEIAKNLEVEEFDLESDNTTDEVSRDKFEKALVDKLVPALDSRKQTITDYKLELFSTIKSNIIESIFGALRALKRQSGLEVTSIMFVAAFSVIVAAYYPKYYVWETSIFDFWIFQDYIDRSVQFVPLLFIPLIISIFWIRFVIWRAKKVTENEKHLSWPIKFSLGRKGVTILSINTLLFIALTGIGSYLCHDRTKLTRSSQLSEIALISNNKLLKNIHLVGTSSRTAFVLIAEPGDSTACGSPDPSICDSDSGNSGEDGENGALDMMYLNRAEIICYPRTISVSGLNLKKSRTVLGKKVQRNLHRQFRLLGSPNPTNSIFCFSQKSFAIPRTISVSGLNEKKPNSPGKKGPKKPAPPV